MAKLGILLYTRGHPEPFSESGGRDETFNPYARNSEVIFF